jgi:enoyl-CoA hydratase/carnithine racemase
MAPFMRILVVAVLLLLAPFSSVAGPFHWLKPPKPVVTAIEHLALGAGTQLAVSQAAGGPSKYGAGLVATGILASVKEGSDVVAHRDTKKKAILHALTIMVGAGAVAAARH